MQSNLFHLQVWGANSIKSALTLPMTYFFQIQKVQVDSPSYKLFFLIAIKKCPSGLRPKEPDTCHGPDLHMDKGHAPSPAKPGVIELARSQPPQISRG